MSWIDGIIAFVQKAVAKYRAYSYLENYVIDKLPQEVDMQQKTLVRPDKIYIHNNLSLLVLYSNQQPLLVSEYTPNRGVTIWAPWVLILLCYAIKGV